MQSGSTYPYWQRPQSSPRKLPKHRHSPLAWRCPCPLHARHVGAYPTEQLQTPLLVQVPCPAHTLPLCCGQARVHMEPATPVTQALHFGGAHHPRSPSAAQSQPIPGLHVPWPHPCRTHTRWSSMHMLPKNSDMHSVQFGGFLQNPTLAEYQSAHMNPASERHGPYK